MPNKVYVARKEEKKKEEKTDFEHQYKAFFFLFCFSTFNIKKKCVKKKDLNKKFMSDCRKL